MIKGFVPLDYIIFMAYLVLSVLIGVIFVKDQKTIEDYFLAGRSMGYISLTTCTLVDLCQRVFGLKTSEQRMLSLARWITIVYGGLVILLAFVVSKLGSLLEASILVLGMVGGPLLGIFLLGMLSRRANSPGVMIGWGFGVFAVVLVGFGKSIAPIIPAMIGKGILFLSNISFLWFGVVGTGVTLIAGNVASQMFPSPTDAQLNGLVINRKSSDLPEQPALDRA